MRIVIILCRDVAGSRYHAILDRDVDVVIRNFGSFLWGFITVVENFSKDWDYFKVRRRYHKLVQSVFGTTE